MNRAEIADLLCDSLEKNRIKINDEFTDPSRIGSFVIDNLFPEDLANRLYAAFPDIDSMRLQKSLKEDKFTAYQLDKYDPLLGEAVYAFQEKKFIDLVSEITEIENLLADDSLYLGGVSVMLKGQFLNPHIDNSHNESFTRYRRLNLLYYVSPKWKLDNGGNFELWDEGLSHPPRTIESRFNRMIVMATSRYSLHSVSPIVKDVRRCCISNYYFSTNSIDSKTYYHGTYFRGRPGQPVRDLILRANVVLKRVVRMVNPTGYADRTHINRSDKD